MSWTSRWRRALLLSLDEAGFTRRGFARGDPAAVGRLEEIGRTLIAGYNAGVAEDSPAAVAARLERIAPELRGFAYEGAAMGCSLVDGLLPLSGHRWEALLDGPGRPYVFMLHLGAGWAAARLPWRRWGLERFRRSLDPVVGWLAVDGFGFYEGCFRPGSRVERQQVPRRVEGYALRAFDQGLGRSLWFVEGAGVDQIARRIARFPRPRRADLWSGVGLACANAGGVTGSAMRRLAGAAAGFDGPLAQGAAFAAAARLTAGNPADHTDLACRVLCGMNLDAAAMCVNAALVHARRETPVNLYERWRQAVQRALTPTAAGRHVVVFSGPRARPA
jgi:hypothetical protein